MYFITIGFADYKWDKARRQQASASDILGLGVNYSFDINKEMDLVTLKDGKILELSETSSGMQSMLPLFVYTDYLTKGVFLKISRQI